MGSAIAIIIAVSIGVGISYLPSQNNRTVSGKSGVSYELSIDYASVRASVSDKFYPPIWRSQNSTEQQKSGKKQEPILALRTL